MVSNFHGMHSGSLRSIFQVATRLLHTHTHSTNQFCYLQRCMLSCQSIKLFKSRLDLGPLEGSIFSRLQINRSSRSLLWPPTCAIPLVCHTHFQLPVRHDSFCGLLPALLTHTTIACYFLLPISKNICNH